MLEKVIILGPSCTNGFTVSYLLPSCGVLLDNLLAVRCRTSDSDCTFSNVSLLLLILLFSSKHPTIKDKEVRKHTSCELIIQLLNQQDSFKSRSQMCIVVLLQESIEAQSQISTAQPPAYSMPTHWCYLLPR